MHTEQVLAECQPYVEHYTPLKALCCPFRKMVTERRMEGGGGGTAPCQVVLATIQDTREQDRELNVLKT